METLKIGSKGDDVVLLQTLLVKKGYGVDTDGIFGKGTKGIVIAFQRANNLEADGIVGKGTWDALMNNSDTAPSRINTTQYVLTEKNYYSEIQSKQNIALHHTNGWTVVKGSTTGRPSMNHFNWWESTDQHVSTAFSIDYAGNIYQHFPNYNHWAYHIGLGSAKNYLDKQSIGIELVNEGHMVKENGEFFWMNDTQKIPYNRPQDKPIFVEDGWRGYNWFAPYSEDQTNSVVWLVKYLCNILNIEKNIIDDFDYHPELLDGKYNGIYMHCNVRKYPDTKKIKHDLSPAFNIKLFKDLLF